MVGIALSIILDKPDKTYEGGETITGQVRVVATEDVRTAALIVVLYCKGYSEKKTRIGQTRIIPVYAIVMGKQLVPRWVVLA